MTAIQATLGGKVSYRSQIDDLQPWDFAAFLYEKRRDFCGREWLFREIDLWLTTNNEPALLITGDPGIGKSALVAELVHRNPGGQVLAYHCCEADVLATVEPARFVRSIAAMIASQLPEYGARLHDPPIKSVLGQEVCERDPFSAFEAGVLTPLQVLRAPDESVRYLLIDALDESLPRGGPCGQGTIVDLLSTFIERLPGWLRIVATSRKESDFCSGSAACGRTRSLLTIRATSMTSSSTYGNSYRRRILASSSPREGCHSKMPSQSSVPMLTATSSTSTRYARDSNVVCTASRTWTSCRRAYTPTMAGSFNDSSSIPPSSKSHDLCWKCLSPRTALSPETWWRSPVVPTATTESLVGAAVPWRVCRVRRVGVAGGIPALSQVVD